HTIGIDNSQGLAKNDRLKFASNEPSTYISGSKRLKQQFSGLFQRGQRSSSRKKTDRFTAASGIIEFDDDDDFVPGCMPRGLKKKKSLPFARSTVPINKKVEKKPLPTRPSSHPKPPSHSRKLSASSRKTRLKIAVAANTSAARPSTSSSATDESLPILTPDTPAIQETQFLYLQSTPRPTNVTPPPVLPSPGLSKDDAHEWHTHLMLQLEQGPSPTPEIVGSRSKEVRRSRSFPEFRNSVSSWELDEMAPMFEIPGVNAPGWYTRFGDADGSAGSWDYGYEENREDLGQVFSSRSLEEDAESVYRACEAMGGTGIVF
ncbi:hypothetical protein AAF712_016753, partial [Marasmius tenuissimus]